jgi:hypothetical protein
VPGRSVQLQRVREAKIADLLDGASPKTLEASGVVVKDRVCHVVFRDLPVVGMFDEALLRATGSHRLVEIEGGHGGGYEDIAYDALAEHFYVLVAAQPFGSRFMAVVEEYDEQLHLVSSKPLDFPFKRQRKGIGGLTCIQREGHSYLLGMCAGNRCKAGAAGGTPGGGRIQVFTDGVESWAHVGTIRLPPTVLFRDYSGLSAAGNRIAVSSQDTSALWVSDLKDSDWEFVEEGTIHLFPRDQEGNTLYCSVEGVAWADERDVVVVSGRSKARTQNSRCQDEEESIGVFAVPGRTEAEVRARSVEPPPRQATALPPVRGLFLQRVSGDDALLRLAQLRFAQAGMAAEAYADTPEQLSSILDLAPAEPVLPTVHLDRRIDLLREEDRSLVAEFVSRFAGRVAGLVVHDRAAMAKRPSDVVTAARELGTGEGRPYVFVEYAAGMDLEQFVDLADRLRDVDGVSMCVDIGHVGIRQARLRFARTHPDADITALGDRLRDLVPDVDEAVGSALPAVLELIRALGPLGKPVHLHLHDGHPLIPGLSDHFSFLMRVPIPVRYQGARSLPPLYGPAGLAEILGTALSSCGEQNTSSTLEIHQAEGRLPLGHAAELFSHWRDLTNAERMNYWLSVLAENHVLASTAYSR